MTNVFKPRNALMELRWLHLSTRCTREQRLPGFVTCPSQHKTCVLSRNTVTPVGTCDIYFSWISCKMTLRHRLVVVPFACQVSLSCPVLLRRCGSLPGGGGDPSGVRSRELQWCANLCVSARQERVSRIRSKSTTQSKDILKGPPGGISPHLDLLPPPHPPRTGV